MNFIWVKKAVRELDETRKSLITIKYDVLLAISRIQEVYVVDFDGKFAIEFQASDTKCGNRYLNTGYSTFSHAMEAMKEWKERLDSQRTIIAKKPSVVVWEDDEEIS